MKDFHVPDVVQLGVMACIFHAPLVDVIAHHVGGAEFGGRNAQYACAAPAVEHALTLGVAPE